MNDTELLATVKDSFAEVRADTPLDRYRARGRTVRARRRRGLAGAAAAAVATAVVLVLAQQPGTGTRPGPVPSTHMAAWTVTEKAPGIIEIKIRELKDRPACSAGSAATAFPPSSASRTRTRPAAGTTPVTRQGPAALAEDLPAAGQRPDGGQRGHGHRRRRDPSRGRLVDRIHPAADPEPEQRHVGRSFGSAYMLVYASGHCPPGS